MKNILKIYIMHKLKNMRLKVLLLALLALSLYNAHAQNFNMQRGVPFVVNYSPADYFAHEQNFDIIQDDKGIMYFANFSGVLVFDGSTWTTVHTSTGLRAISLAINNNGEVFVGGLNDFGCIITKPDNSIHFISLADSITDNLGVGEIIDVFAVNDKVFFISEKRIYIYNKENEVNIIKVKNDIQSAFFLEKKLFVFFKPDVSKLENIQNGLTVFENGKFIRISDESNLWIDDIVTMFKRNNNEIILGTSRQGFFSLKGTKIKELYGSVNEYVRKKGMICGTTFGNKYLFGTLTGGIVFSDEKGEIIQIIDKKSNLIADAINKIFVDKNNDLWAVTQNGISLVKLKWPFTYIKNNENGFNGNIQKFCFFHDKLFVATNKGLSYLNDSVFVVVDEIKYSCWDIESDKQSIFAATTKGVYEINEKGCNIVGNKEFSYSLYCSKLNERIIYVGQRDRIEILENINGDYVHKDYITGFDGYVSKIDENTDGNLYIEVSPNKIYFYEIKTKKIIDIDPKKSFFYMHLNKIDNSIFFTTELGLRKFIKEKNSIVKFSFPKKYNIKKDYWAYDFFQISDKKMFFTDGEQKNISLLSNNINDSKNEINIFNPISGKTINTFFFDKRNDNLWLGTKNEIIIYDTKFELNKDKDIKSMIREILNLNKDSLLYVSDNEDIIRLKYSNNSLRFKFSAPLFPAVGKVKYRYFLNGFDVDTSDWNTLVHKDYTNLPDREYEFYVEAEDEFGLVVGAAKYKFEVITPVYRRWWAIIIYIAMVIGIGKLILDRRVQIAEKEKDVLELLVKERTEEIAKSKEEIELQRDYLYKQRQEIIDSINYAKKIQEAVLPAQDYTNKILDNHFIFFKPRDIVSGDFYWMKKINNFIIVVAADCTGHGVPGAFMSMLGSSYLNEIITRRSLDSAGQILNRLRLKVKKSLHQKGEEGEQKDGMDIALIIIDEETLELQYSGAYNPLYLIRNNNGETPKFIETKADRQPIGIHIHEKDFTNHKLQLQKDDSLYIFSDGFIDQFGGETGGKFKTVRYKELLISIQDRTMEEQKLAIEQTFVKWKRDLKQIDDVLVIGIRI